MLTPSGTYGEESLTIAKNRTVAPVATWTDEEHIRFEVNNSWRYEIEHFFEAIENDTPIKIGNSQDAFQLMSLLDRIYQHT